MTNRPALHSQSQGHRNGNDYVVDGFDIRGFSGRGTSIEIVGRPLHPTKLNVSGEPAETLWHSKEEADAAAMRVAAGDESGIRFSSYSND